MFKFLKLRNSVSGDARRHVPFRSIINKHFSILFAFVFSFIAIVPVKVNAAAPQLHPEFKPILDTDIVNFQDSYLNLDPAAQAAANILFGAYVTEYAGLADYGTVFDSVPTDTDIWGRLEFIGEQVVDTIFLPVNMADQLVLTPLINLGQGIVQKVKTVTTLSSFKDTVMNSDYYKLMYDADIGFALNQLFARQQGLYQWQFSNYVYYPDMLSFTWRTTNVSDSVLSDFNDAVANLNTPRVQFNRNDSLYNGVVSSNFFSLYRYVFLNQSTGYIYLCDASGNEAPSSFSTTYCVNIYNNGSSAFVMTNSYNLHSNRLIYSNYNNISELFNAISADPSLLCYFNVSQWKLALKDFVNGLYYGDSWENKKAWDTDIDLGFVDTDSLEVLNPDPDKELLFDLKQMMQQLLNVDSALEVPLKPIIYNITEVNGNPLTAQDLQGISFNVTPPESGIDVPIGVFIPFFDDGKGFISYMWHMTKPLVKYTRSFLDTITFDPVDGFNASGPGYFILGVAGLGLIGGVIVKFLL